MKAVIRYVWFSNRLLNSYRRNKHLHIIEGNYVALRFAFVKNYGSTWTACTSQYCVEPISMQWIHKTTMNILTQYHIEIENESIFMFWHIQDRYECKIRSIFQHRGQNCENYDGNAWLYNKHVNMMVFINFRRQKKRNNQWCLNSLANTSVVMAQKINTAKYITRYLLNMINKKIGQITG